MSRTVKIAGIGISSLFLLLLAALHWVVPGVFESSLNVVLEHDPYVIRSDAQALHDDLFVADLHTDSMLWKRNFLEESSIGHVDLPRLHKGNVALQVFSATTKSPSGQNYEKNTADSDNITLLAQMQMWPFRTWGSIFERALYQLGKLTTFAAESNNQLVLIRNRTDMQALITRSENGEKVVGGIYLIEGAHPLEGNLDNLNRLYDEGLRVMGLTHFFDNRLGGSLHGLSGEGLTSFGRQSVIRAAELGVIIDVAHASPQMVNDVLDMGLAPVILSHGGVKGICDGPRNLDDALMQRIAAGGGVVGIGFWDAAVCDYTPLGVVRAIRYAIDLLGVEHVALGSDYDGTTEVLFDASELAVLTQTMLDQNFSEQEIRRVMGSNVKRFFLDNLPQ